MTANPSVPASSAPNESGGTTVGRPSPRWGARRVFVLEVGLLLMVPVLLGGVLGWYYLNPPQNELRSPTGTEAHDLLNSFPDNQLVVEIAYQSSASPPPASALGILEQRINETCSKNVVTWSIHSFSNPQNTFSDADLLSLMTAHRETWPGPGTMSLFYLYLAGGYAPDSSVLGIAFRGSSIAVFAGTISANAPAGAAAGVTATVLVHEFGHELGLVGLVGSAPNEDPAHPYHSNDPNDVMYWSVDTTTSLLGIFGGSATPTQFDAADLSDLANVRSAWIPVELLPWLVLTAVLIAVAILIARHARTRSRLRATPSATTYPESVRRGSGDPATNSLDR